MAFLDIDGKKRELNLTWDAAFEAKNYPDIFGENFNIFKFFAEYGVNFGDPDVFAKMLWLALYHNSRELTPDDVKQMLRNTEANFVEIAEQLQMIVRRDKPEVSKDNEKKKMMKPKSKVPKKK